MSLLSLSGKIPIFTEASLRLRHQLLVDYTICCGLGSLKPNHLPLNNNNWTLFRHLMENCSFIRSGVISVNQKITEDGGSSTMNMILNQITEECCHNPRPSPKSKVQSRKDLEWLYSAMPPSPTHHPPQKLFSATRHPVSKFYSGLWQSRV